MRVPYTRNLLLSTVGFERLIDAFEKLDATGLDAKTQSYPPYNILKKDERDYAIEIAVAGFRRDEIEIEAEGSKLTVSGRVKAERQGEYLHRGIGTRDFSHQFTLAETLVVRSADIQDGLLIIALENVIPEEKRPRKIPIGQAFSATAKEASLLVDERKAA